MAYAQSSASSAAGADPDHGSARPTPCCFGGVGFGAAAGWGSVELRLDAPELRAFAADRRASAASLLRRMRSRISAVMTGFGGGAAALAGAKDGAGGGAAALAGAKDGAGGGAAALAGAKDRSRDWRRLCAS